MKKKIQIIKSRIIIWLIIHLLGGKKIINITGSTGFGKTVLLTTIKNSLIKQGVDFKFIDGVNPPNEKDISTEEIISFINIPILLVDDFLGAYRSLGMGYILLQRKKKSLITIFSSQKVIFGEDGLGDDFIMYHKKDTLIVNLEEGLREAQALNGAPELDSFRTVFHPNPIFIKDLYSIDKKVNRVILPKKLRKLIKRKTLKSKRRLWYQQRRKVKQK